jgi:hypothetical protein
MEFQNFYSSLQTEDLRNAHTILIDKPQRRPRHSWENKNETDLGQTRCDSVDTGQGSVVSNC